ncbi:MAG: isoamylase early set domain-containing protein [Fibrobacter sp.]|jgi:1,4-alpha-glucan branching enzyme|nr:isoamylase early set domain-containing protein [Fibrobacter sp.]
MATTKKTTAKTTTGTKASPAKSAKKASAVATPKAAASKGKTAAAAKSAKAAKAPKKNATVFSVFAPDCKSVCVAGEFNSWNPAKGKMKKDKSGNWTASVDLPAGDHQYKLVFDEIYWETDKSNPNRVPDGQGGENSVKNV